MRILIDTNILFFSIAFPFVETGKGIAKGS